MAWTIRVIHNLSTPSAAVLPTALPLLPRALPLLPGAARIITKKKDKEEVRISIRKTFKPEIRPCNYQTCLQDTHVELLGRGGLYAHPYETQFGQKLEAPTSEPARSASA